MPSEYLATYKKPSSGRQNGNSSDKELIDISSDDEQTPKTSYPTTTSTTSMSYKHERDTMDYEPIQVSKRPHLCPTIESVSRTTVVQQHQQQQQEQQQVWNHDLNLLFVFKCILLKTNIFCLVARDANGCAKERQSHGKIAEEAS